MKLTTAALLVTLVMTLALASGCSDDDGGGGQTPTAAADATAEASPAAIGTLPAGPTTFHVLAGRTEGSVDVEAFMPADVRIRAGDSIEWTAHGFEGHTITFGNGDDTLAGIGPYLLPDPNNPEQQIFSPTLALASVDQGPHTGDTTFINSGFIGVPAEAKYSLTFAKPGLYTYLCLVHPFTMTGTVTVEPAGTTVDTPETVSARGEAESALYTGELQQHVKALQDQVVSAAGPGDSTVHYIQVGAITDHGQAAVYTPSVTDISPGDTVIFQNDDRNFHNVIFQGDRAEAPPGIGIVPDPGGRGLNFSLDRASAIAVDPPPEGFGPSTFLSSGSLGVLQPRLTWTLRFDTPGQYTYRCTIHVLAGMVGVINVR